jgi:hypothetical protein
MTTVCLQNPLQCESSVCFSRSRSFRKHERPRVIKAYGDFEEGDRVVTRGFHHVFHELCFKLALCHDKAFLLTGKNSQCVTGRASCWCLDAMAATGLLTDPTPEEAANFGFSYYIRNGLFREAARLHQLSSRLITHSNLMLARSNGKFIKFVESQCPELKELLCTPKPGLKAVSGPAIASFPKASGSCDSGSFDTPTAFSQIAAPAASLCERGFVPPLSPKASCSRASGSLDTLVNAQTILSQGDKLLAINPEGALPTAPIAGKPPRHPLREKQEDLLWRTGRKIPLAKIFNEMCKTQKLSLNLIRGLAATSSPKESESRTLAVFNA